MEYPHVELLKNFDEHSLPDLDECVFGALELFTTVRLPTFNPGPYTRLLVVGSMNAEVTSRIIFKGADVIFANESTYQDTFHNARNIDAVVIVSASGGKHAVSIAQYFGQQRIATWLLTNNSDAPAKQHIQGQNILVFPKNREPYTYNTSTYLGMILSKTREDPRAISDFIQQEVAPRIPDNLADFNAFFLLVPPELDIIRGMLLTKFDELFGPKVVGRVFTDEQAKHAKTVIPSEKELFISFGEASELFGTPETRLHIPLPSQCGFGAMMAIGYYVIGNIQKQHPPYFKEHIIDYTTRASEIFKQNIIPIVE
jgi:hypothetical protein